MGLYWLTERVNQTAPLLARPRIPKRDSPACRTVAKRRVVMNANLVPVMWSVWAFVAIVTAALYAYRSSLTKDEEDQLFLDEAFNHEKAVQTEILRKVSRVEPAVRMSLI